MFEGCLGDDELRAFYQQAARLAARTDALAGIADFSEVTSIGLSWETVRRLAESPSVFPDHDRTRLIVAPSPEVSGFAGLFAKAGISKRPLLYVVKSMREALAILGSPKAEFKPLRE
jgi:hypothetical protein